MVAFTALKVPEKGACASERVSESVARMTIYGHMLSICIYMLYGHKCYRIFRRFFLINITATTTQLTQFGSR